MTPPTFRPALSLALLALAGVAAADDPKLSRADIARRGKAATALVDVKGRRFPTGSNGRQRCVWPWKFATTADIFHRSSNTG